MSGTSNSPMRSDRGPWSGEYVRVRHGRREYDVVCEPGSRGVHYHVEQASGLDVRTLRDIENEARAIINDRRRYFGTISIEELQRNRGGGMPLK